MAHRTRTAGARGDRLDAVLLCVLVALCAAVLAGFAWTRPTRTQAWITYSQHGTLSYTGTTGPTSVYGPSGLKTGEPVYLSEVSTLRLVYDYQFESRSPATLKGTEQLLVKVDSGQGITRSLPLQPVTAFKGSRFTAAGTLSFANLQAITSTLAHVEGTVNGGGTYTVSIMPTVHVGGHVGASRLATVFDPVMSFTFRSSNPAVLTPGSAGFTAAGAGKAAAKQFSITDNGSVPIAGGKRTSAVGLPVWDVRVGTLALVGGALIAATLIGLPLLWEATSEDERVRIGRRYGSTLVQVDSLPDSPGMMVVDLSSFDGLRQVARRLECPILHLGRGSDVYAVVDNGTLYRYAQLQRAKGTRGAHNGRPTTSAATSSHNITVTSTRGKPS